MTTTASFSIKELNSEAFANALSYCDQIGMDMAELAESENQKLDFEEYCDENNILFNKNGTPL
jgi:hypothetical protein